MDLKFNSSSYYCSVFVTNTCTTMKKSIFSISLILAGIYSSQQLHAQKDFDPITFGNYRYVHSEFMNEDRQLFVHLPDDYENSDESYPVVFQLWKIITG